jgi:glycosyltransferase involved in cell wall biosynthesis
MRVCLLSSVHRALDNRIFFREARTLARAGHEVTLIAVHDRDEVRDGIHIVALPSVPRWRRPVLWRLLLRRALATDADIFHFHDPELLFVIPLLRLRSGRPTVYDVHEAYPEFLAVKDYLPAWVRYPMAWMFRLLEPPLARFHSALVFADDATPTAFRRVRRPKVVLHNFPDTELIQAGGSRLDTVATREPVVIYLGGLERNRGSRLMIEAFAQVHRKHPEARLLHVGHFMPPELEQEVLLDAQRRGLEEAVRFVGRVPFDEVGRHLERAAVGWVTWQPYPKNQKNIPTKLFEYMAYGLPVVSSDLDSTRRFVEDGVSGHLVRADNVGAHAEAIIGLLEDRRAAAAIGLRGREQVLARYNWRSIESRLLDLYELLARSSHRVS